MLQNGFALNPSKNRKIVVASVIVFVLAAVAGLSYVKWWPYYDKAVHAIDTGSIGSSILSGGERDAPDPSWSAAWSYTVAYYKAVWKAAVLGILLGSLVQVLLPSGWLLRALGRNSAKSAAIGGLAAMPGMMCTCCAAPIAVGLRKKNVSAGASLAFWLGNPMINVATLVFMTAVQSWKFTLLRLVFGLLVTFGVSYVAGRMAGNVEVPQDKLDRTIRSETSAPLWKRWLSSIWSMAIHLVPAYFLSVLVLGAARAWLFPTLGDGAFDSALLLLVFSIAGALFVIPTAAEIPIIQTFLALGVATAPTASLLVVLPALSLPSLLMIRRSFPARVVAFVFGSVVLLGILCGIVGALVL